MRKYHLPSAPVAAQQKIAPHIFQLTVIAPAIAREAQPGQFVHLRCGPGHEPLLRRPLSISAVERDQGLFSLVYQVVGPGTTWLSQVRAGETLDVMGPLGHGFTTGLTGKRIGLVAGGMGMAPLNFLGSVLGEKNEVSAFWGGRSKAFLPELTPGFNWQIITEDESHERQGLVTELLQGNLAHLDYLFACGPRPMLKAVVRLAQKAKIPLEVSLETVMACGVGACLGCVVAGALPGTQFQVCQDGPVFRAEEIAWEGV